MDSIINGLTSDDPKIREAAFETAAESTDASVVDRLIELVQAGTGGKTKDRSSKRVHTKRHEHIADKGVKFHLAAKDS